MAIYLDPKNDLTFKRVFGEKAPKELLENESTREAIGWVFFGTNTIVYQIVGRTN